MLSNENSTTIPEIINYCFFINNDFDKSINLEEKNDFKENICFEELKKFADTEKLDINNKILNNCILDLTNFYINIFEKNNDFQERLNYIICPNFNIVTALVISSYKNKIDFIEKSKIALKLIFNLNEIETTLIIDKLEKKKNDFLDNNYKENIKIYTKNEKYFIEGKNDLIKNICLNHFQNDNTEILINLFIDEDNLYYSQLFDLKIPIYSSCKINFNQKNIIVNELNKDFNSEDLLIQLIPKYKTNILLVSNSFLKTKQELILDNLNCFFYNIFNIKYTKNYESLLPQYMIDNNNKKLVNNYTKKTNKIPIIVMGINPYFTNELIVKVLNNHYDCIIEISDYNYEILSEKLLDIIKKVTNGSGLILDVPYLDITNILNLKNNNFPIIGVSFSKFLPELSILNQISLELIKNNIKFIYLHVHKLVDIFNIIKLSEKNRNIIINLILIDYNYIKKSDFIYKIIREQPNIILIIGKDCQLKYIKNFYEGNWINDLEKMPIDAVLICNNLLTTKDCKIDISGKKIIKETNNYDKLMSLDGSYFYTKKTEASKLWKKYDEIYFQNNKKSNIKKDIEDIKKELNKYYPKKYFGDIDGCTYYQILKQMTNIMTYNNSSIWIHPDYEIKTKIFLKRVLNIFNIKLGIGFDQDSFNILKYIEDYQNKEWIIPLFVTNIHITERNFFINLCKKKGQKIVNFLPIIDDEFEFWFKTDIKNLCEDLNSVDNYCIQNTIISCLPFEVDTNDNFNRNLNDELILLTNTINENENKRYSDINNNSISLTFENGDSFYNYLNNDNISSNIKNIIVNKKIKDIINFETDNPIYNLITDIKDEININMKQSYLEIYKEQNLYITLNINDDDILSVNISVKEQVFNFDFKYFKNDNYVLVELFDNYKLIRDLKKKICNETIITQNLYKKFKKNLFSIKDYNLNIFIIIANCNNIIEKYFLENNIFNFNIKELEIHIIENIPNNLINQRIVYNLEVSRYFEIRIMIKNINYINISFPINNILTLKKKYIIEIQDNYMIYFLKNHQSIILNKDSNIFAGLILEFLNDKITRDGIEIGSFSVSSDLLNFLDKYNLNKPSYIKGILIEKYCKNIKKNNFFLENYDFKAELYNLDFDVFFKKIGYSPIFFIIIKLLQNEEKKIKKICYKVIKNIEYGKNLFIEKKYIGKIKSADIFRSHIFHDSEIHAILDINSIQQHQLHFFPQYVELTTSNMKNIYNNYPVSENILQNIDLYFRKNYDISLLNIILLNPKSLTITRRTNTVCENYKNLENKDCFFTIENEKGLSNDLLFSNIISIIYQLILFKFYKNNNVISDNCKFLGIKEGFLTLLISIVKINPEEILEFVFLTNLSKKFGFTDDKIIENKIDLIVEKNIEKFDNIFGKLLLTLDFKQIEFNEVSLEKLMVLFKRTDLDLKQNTKNNLLRIIFKELLLKYLDINIDLENKCEKNFNSQDFDNIYEYSKYKHIDKLINTDLEIKLYDI